jgi:signal transduction histidine kinase
MAQETGMDRPQKLSTDSLAQLRRLAHDLSNSLETIVQAAYLMGQTKLEAKNKKLLTMLDQAAQDAVRINRSLREILRSQNERPENSRAS